MSVFRSKVVILSSACLALLLVVTAVCITVVFNKDSLEEDRNEPTTELFTDPPSNLFIISRDLWQALEPLECLSVKDPALLVVIKHTGGASCTDFQTCSAQVREIQKEDMKQYPDIRYNFLIGGDGRIYEGRGWLVQNEGIRNESVDIAFIGDFNTDVPSDLMLSRTRNLIMRGGNLRKINYQRYYEVAHNHTEPTDSPGENLYKLLSHNLHHYSTEVCYYIEYGKVVTTEICPPS